MLSPAALSTGIRATLAAAIMRMMKLVGCARPDKTYLARPAKRSSAAQPLAGRSILIVEYEERLLL